MNHVDVLAKESKVATQKRKELAEKWAARVQFDKAVIKEEGVSSSACRSVLLGYVLASLTGDFSTAKQETVAKKSGVSVRTVRNCARALRRMGLLFVKHNYKTDELGRKKRIASYTILGAFRKQFEKTRAYLKSYQGIAPIEAIVQKIANISVAAETASLFKSFNKVLSNFGFLDQRTGELLTADDGFKQVRRETYLAMRGV